jgi:tetratricopeptide (TPR) repeat protein
MLLAAPRAGAGQAHAVEKAGSSVVSLTIYDSSGNAVGRGHGFFVDIGRLVTSRSVLDRASRATVRLREREYPVTAVLADDPRMPLVVLAVDLPDGCPEALAIRRAGLRAGDTLTLLEGGVTPPATAAVSSTIDLPGFGPVVLTGAPLPATADGCPLIDAAGGVAAIAVRRTREDASVILVPGDRVYALQARQPLPLAEWAAALTPIRQGMGRAEADTALAAGSQLMLDKDFAGALAHFTQLVARQPKDVDALLGVGLCNEEVGNRAEAVDAYRRALALRPDDARTWHRVAVLSLDLSRWEEAIEAFRQVSRVRPIDPQPLFNIGVVCGTLGRRQQEIDAYLAALRLNNRHVGALVNLGVAYTLTGRMLDAIDYLTRAVRLSPSSAEAQVNLGIALANLRRNEEAAATLQRAIELKPDYARAHYALGVVYLQMGNTAKALEEQQRLDTLDRNQAAALRARMKAMKIGT